MGKTTIILTVVLAVCLISAGWALLNRAPAPPLPSLTIEVLNGCGEEGLAARTAQHLRDLGQDVVRVEDAQHQQHARTILVDRAGKPWLAHRLAERLGDVLVVLERDESSDADLTLIVGHDHARSLLLR